MLINEVMNFQKMVESCSVCIICLRCWVSTGHVSATYVHDRPAVADAELDSPPTCGLLSA